MRKYKIYSQKSLNLAQNIFQSLNSVINLNLFSNYLSKNSEILRSYVTFQLSNEEKSKFLPEQMCTTQYSKIYYQIPNKTIKDLDSFILNEQFEFKLTSLNSYLTIDLRNQLTSEIVDELQIPLNIPFDQVFN